MKIEEKRVLRFQGQSAISSVLSSLANREIENRCRIRNDERFICKQVSSISKHERRKTNIIAFCVRRFSLHSRSLRVTKEFVVDIALRERAVSHSERIILRMSDADVCSTSLFIRKRDVFANNDCRSPILNSTTTTRRISCRRPSWCHDCRSRNDSRRNQDCTTSPAHS